MQELIFRYKSRGLLLDTNLLVLLFVGLADIGEVSEFKRTRNQGFTDKEFTLLEGIVQRFSKIVTTPHVLTETSNMLFQVRDRTRRLVLEVAARNIRSFKERGAEARGLLQSEAFYDFGLTDCGILDLPPRKYLVLSIDAALVIALNKKGVDAVNFNHIRQLNWK